MSIIHKEPGDEIGSAIVKIDELADNIYSLIKSEESIFYQEFMAEKYPMWHILKFVPIENVVDAACQIVEYHKTLDDLLDKRSYVLGAKIIRDYLNKVKDITPMLNEKMVFGSSNEETVFGLLKQKIYKFGLKKEALTKEENKNYLSLVKAVEEALTQERLREVSILLKLADNRNC